MVLWFLARKQKQEISKKQSAQFQTKTSQRVTALFLSLVFVITLGFPVYPVFAEPINNSNELILNDGSAGDVPYTLNTKYRDSRVNGVNTEQKPLAVVDQKQTFSQTQQVTEEAKNTVISVVDPVTSQKQVNNAKQSKPIIDKELVDKRTADSKTFLNTDGSETVRLYTAPVHYKTSGKGSWKNIEGSFQHDDEYNKSEAAKESLLSRLLPGKPYIKTGIEQSTGVLRAKFKPAGENESNVVGFDGTQAFNFNFINANPRTNPELGTYDDGAKYVVYKNVWQNTDVYYDQEDAALKEALYLLSKDTPRSFGFSYEGATLSYGTNDEGVRDGTIKLTLDDGTEIVIPKLYVFSKATGPKNDAEVSYRISNNKLFIDVDQNWLNNIPESDFPVVIDPTYEWRGVSTSIPGGDYGQFIAYDNRGYVCSSQVCDVYAGSLNDGGWKNWRTMMHLPLSNVFGQNVSWANFYTERVNRYGTWSGFDGNRPYEVTWAHCFGYNCFSGAPRASAWVDWANNFDATALMQWISQNNVGDGWLMIKAVNESDIQSYKNFWASHTYLDVNFKHYNQETAIPALQSPVNGEVISVSRPTLKMSSVGDPDGDIVRYAFHLLDKKGNIIAHSGETDTTWWTIPDNLLVDGEQYSWRGYVQERNASNQSIIESPWRPTETRSFTYDLRTGKDKSQSFDDVGPLSVSLNKGNVTTGAASHDMGALGGSIGIGLEYNTPGLSEQGLTGYYYNGLGTSKQLAIKVKDATVDMSWGTGSPYPGTAQSDNFTINWKGYFIAPATGAYYFGSNQDDHLTFNLTHDGINDKILDNGCCSTVWRNDKPVTLQKGQAYPVDVWFEEYGGAAGAHLYVRTPDGVERTMPSTWLRTIPDSTSQDNLGLAARFYKNNDPAGNPSYVINDKTPLVFATKVPTVSKDWGTNTMVPYDIGGLYNDYMIANYSGYLTIPVSGEYKIGGGSDDGLRIRLGGKEVTNSWSPHGYAETWPTTTIHFEAGQVVPISVDYFEATSVASAYLMWDGPAGRGVIPGQYLSTEPSVLPRGWSMSIDPDGSIPYERIVVKPNGNAELLDSDGFTHIYTWTGSGFKPPVNEDGYLVRNTDASYTLNDVDGRIYEFSTLGVITKITSPFDDKKPSALQYEYTNTSLSEYTVLPKITRIIDGVDPSRYGQVYYWGESGASDVCKSTGYSAPPTGYVCGFKTFPADLVDPANSITRFYYDSNSMLARVEQPGGELIDYSYDADGRIAALRDIAANDAISAGLRNSDDQTLLTTITYDNFFRASKVTAPAPYAAASVPAGQSNVRSEHLFEYGFQSSTRRVNNAPTTSVGYQQYIEYDDLYRTTKACDNLGLCSEINYHPQKDLVFASIDSQGIKSTTIYDDNDNAVEEYGGVPASWFPTPVNKYNMTATERRPLAAYADRVVKNESSYDESMTSIAVAWQGARGESLFGGSKLHTTGIDATSVNHMGRDFRTSPVTLGLDTTVTPGYGFSATGKIKFPATGDYTFKIQHDDGSRIFIDDTQVVDGWTKRTDGATQNTDQGIFKVTDATKTYRFRADYIHFDDGKGAGVIDMWLSGPGITDTQVGMGTNMFGSIVSPAYGLITTVKTTEKDRGISTVKTEYQDPAYGLVKSTTLDPTGLNMSSSATYEPTSTGYFRQLTKTLPGGNVTNYTYYSATQSVDNPCTTVIDAVSQAGRLKFKTEMDPDGAGPKTGRKTETIYDQYGRVVAMRLNNESWTCTEYDSRGRIVKAVVPAAMSGTTVLRAGKTLQNNYTYGGNPFVTTMQDETGGFILTETDLLGRTVRYLDQRGFETKSYYNDYGQLVKRTGPAGVEEYIFNAYGQLITQKQDSQVVATLAYDNQGRVATVDVPSVPGLSLSEQTYDEYQRQIGQKYSLPTQTSGLPNVITEEVKRAIGGDVLATSLNNINLADGVALASSTTNQYTYDAADRLTTAKIAGNQYDYGYGTQDATTCSGLTINPKAAQDSNRTSYRATTDGVIKQASNYCYDYADRLIKTSDLSVGVPVYDDHGNITRIGSLSSTKDSTKSNQIYTSFIYDNADRNMSITQGTNKIAYLRDGQGRITRTTETKPGTKVGTTITNSYNYGYTGSGDSPDFMTDANNVLIENYIPLPAGMLLTIRPTQTTIAAKYSVSLSNMHGDTLAVVDGLGQIKKALQLYNPYGERIVASTAFMNVLGVSADVNAQNLKKLLDTTLTIADNRTGTSDYGWLGEHQKQTETLFTSMPIQMGSRVYIPGLGRFLQMDPIEGGGANAYSYPTDPVNDFDLDGNNWFRNNWKTIAKVGIAVGAGVAGAAFCGATAGIGCAVMAGAALGAASGAASNAIDQHGNGKKFSWKSFAKDTIVGGVVGGVSGGVAAKAGPVLKGIAQKVQGRASLALRSVKNFFSNGNNVFRITKSRMSIGPAPARFGNGRLGSKIPIHIHLEKNKGFIQSSRTGRLIKRLWGNFNE
jgi:RHS repeat-associated protein